MKLSPIIAQIQAECSSFKQVAGSASSDMELKASPASLPAAYVILSDMDGDLSERYGNEFEQELTERFIVLIVLDNRGKDHRGQAAADTLGDLRRELFKAILQWSPDDEHDPIELEGGSLADFPGDRLFYAFQFKTTTTLRKEDTWQQVAYERLQSFDTLHVNVDKIEDGTKAPDGRIEAALNFDYKDGA